MALVVKSVKADPALGSDIDTAITISPKHTLGRTSFLSSSGAKEEIANAGPKLDSNTGKATAIDIFAISSRTKTASKWLRPAPPYFSGRLIPKKPNSANLFKISLLGGLSFFSISLATSISSFSANFFAVSFNARCCSVKLKSISEVSRK